MSSGVPWDDVHEEAEQLEHAMTPRFEAYVRASVGDAKTCPHGHPIRVGERIDGVPLADCEPGAKVTILRLENEAEDLLHYLKEAGIEPGLGGRGGLQRRGDRVASGRTARPRPSPPASPRRSRCWPIRRRRRAPRCPSSSCSAASARAAEALLPSAAGASVSERCRAPPTAH